MIEIRHLSHTLGKNVILDDVNLTIPDSTVMGLVGITVRERPHFSASCRAFISQIRDEFSTTETVSRATRKQGRTSFSFPTIPTTR